LRGLALGVFLITVGMRLDLAELIANWPLILGALLGVLTLKALLIIGLIRWRGSRAGTAVETGLMMASPSELTLIVLASALAAGVLGFETVAFWTIVTALGLTLTPLLAAAGKRMARQIDPQALASSASDAVERFGLSQAAALVLTMDDPVLTVRLTRDIRATCPDLSIVARARDGVHAAQLYNGGATDAVPETMEGSLQISEAVLVDVGVAMGPVIASIHEKRSQLRAAIRKEGSLDSEPALGRRR
jgi:CPA2 family monovalent cation:H+ antiporter-2